MRACVHSHGSPGEQEAKGKGAQVSKLALLRHQPVSLHQGEACFCRHTLNAENVYVLKTRISSNINLFLILKYITQRNFLE